MIGFFVALRERLAERLRLRDGQGCCDCSEFSSDRWGRLRKGAESYGKQPASLNLSAKTMMMRSVKGAWLSNVGL
jgi:hypothetical protein